MPSARRRTAAAIALMSVTLPAACSGGGGSDATPHARATAAVHLLPKRILRTPSNLVSVAAPQTNGILWALAGTQSAGLFQIDAQTGAEKASVSVSGAARSVAESSTGILGVALGTHRSGALELLDGATTKAIKTVPLPAPAKAVAIGSDGVTFYVLDGWANSASVAIVNSRHGKIRGSVPVPADTVSIVPDIQQAVLYVLERNGLVSEIAISSGTISDHFAVGQGRGRSLALSPDGSTLYVLKGTDQVANIAVVNVATEAVKRVLPAPSHCKQVLLSASGNQLYEVSGTARYGNIQVFVV
jgi:hypothetical protein